MRCASSLVNVGGEPSDREDAVSTQLETRAIESKIADLPARDWLVGGMPVADDRLEIDGVETAVLEGGAGQPIVLLHGPGEFAARWMRVIPELVATNRVVAPDLPGHGASGPIPGGVDEDSALAWLDGLIARTCASPPVLVGHLLGGAIAARYAVRHADRIERLVLVDSFGLARFRPSVPFGIALLRYLARPSERSYDRFMSQCLVDPEGFDRRLGRDAEALRSYMIDRARTPSVKAAMRAFMKSLGVPAIPAEDLRRISVPTSLIWGRHDRANRLRIAESASGDFGWPLYVIDGAADDPVLEQPEAFLRALREALSMTGEE
jgi:pimeloyl-ACP methyl ester carboxylesterase